MKKVSFLFAACLCLSMTACQADTTVPDMQNDTQASTESITDAVTETVSGDSESGTNGKIAGTEDMVEPQDVVQEGMVPVTADVLTDGIYTVTVDSSSAMFSITECTLTVENGTMTADMTMSGTGYLYLYMGTAEEAAAADESSYIPFTETDGVHTFTVPVCALDDGIACAAYSKRKEMWYDRTLVFRADSLPDTAYAQPLGKTVSDLGLSDGAYTVDVTLEGGSGRASVQSPARLVITNGNAVAEIVWSSKNYDYMLVDEERYEPVSLEETAVFEIPVAAFDRRLNVVADTTAMSEPHEVEYTLYFDSGSIVQ